MTAAPERPDLDRLAVAGRTVIVRADLNVPMTESGGIFDDGRIRAAVPTIEALRERGARVVVLSHLGRPKGQATSGLSLAPVARRLGELIGRPVAFVPVPCGPELEEAVGRLESGDVLLAENVRFDPRETSKDADERDALAREWAAIGDAFVSDGFGVVHREQASVTGLPRRLPHAAGLLVEAERRAFDRVLRDPARPYTVIMGGSKVSDKIGVIEHLLGRVDRVLIGGGMAFTFLRARGGTIGDSLCEESMLDTCRDILRRADERGVEIHLPSDAVIAREIAGDAETEVVDASAIPDGWRGLDIGPRTAADFAAAIAASATVVWNGPMGVFEQAPFAEGTRRVAEALAASDAFTVVGGGDSAAAIRALGIPESSIDHISTGGGASLELLEGRTLPGLAVLEETP